MKFERLKEEVAKGFDHLDNGIVSIRTFSEIAREAAESLIQGDINSPDRGFPLRTAD